MESIQINDRCTDLRGLVVKIDGLFVCFDDVLHPHQHILGHFGDVALPRL